MKTSLPILLWLALLLTPILVRAQLVNDGATNTLSNVTNIIPGGVTVGTNGSFALLMLANNCLLTNSGLSEIGRNSTARSNEVRLISPTARWHMLNPLIVGLNGGFNRLAISNGAAVQSSQGVIGNSSASASNNTVIVNGAGSAWSVATSFIVGLIGSSNRLQVSDGGRVNSDSGFIGEVASNNVVLVTGSGSVWSNATDLTIGSARSSNRLVVSNTGSVFVGGTVLLGNLAASSNNQLTVNGGALRVTNAAATGTLNVRRGTATLDAGLIEVDRLLVTNSQGSFVFNGGTLSSKSTIATNQFSFDIGNNVGAATFILAGNGTHTFTALTVDNLGTLTGNGTVVLPVPNLVVVLDTGTISPGASIGKMTFNNQLLVFGTIFMEISRNGAVLTNDQIQISGGLSHSGHLIVTNIGTTPLAAGDRFPLFSAQFATNSLLSLTLPPLGTGLTWTNKFPVDGSIEVLGLIVRTLPASAVASNTATLNGVVNPGGHNTTAWFEYGSTTNYGNVTAPQALGSGTDPVNVNEVLTGLFGGVTYYFRAVASNSFGVLFGTNQSFTLPSFYNINAGLPPVSWDSAAWGDYDNDGRLDILLTGLDTNNSPISQIWRNTGSGFTNINAGLTPVGFSSVSWGDYDNDGRLDILLTGANSGGAISQIWRNTNGGFIDINAGLPGVSQSAADWADYDNDGRLDILLTGTTGSNDISQIWRNTGSGFTNINAGLPGVLFGSVDWGDYDNDGRLDILLTGTTNASSNTNVISQIWRNTGTGFTNINAGLPGVVSGSVDYWGDYDNDGRLDILLTGNSGIGSIGQVWRNNTPITNTPPNAPSGLNVTLFGLTATFSWNAANDTQTSASGLTYNLRVGTTPGGSELVGPMAAASGLRRLPRLGNAQMANSRFVTAPPGQPMYWSVQAVDTVFAGSPFAPEQTFTFNSVFTPTNGVPVPGDQNGDGIVSKSELAAVLANLNGNGVFTEGDLNLVLSNYFATSPWLSMTNVTGLGGTNVTFALTNDLAGAFSVEFTTNLLDWHFLGPATPRYLFTDTNAPSVPQRYYRLRWP